MMKIRCSVRVFIRNGKIRRSIPMGFEHANEEQVETIELIKPVLHTWLKSKISQEELPNVTVVVRVKYIETSNGLTVDFKVQEVTPTEFGA